ncbi:uncharacterized protein [Elaeis guineensis]|uniref:uncharacterized protein n=1 Tax=Elaeis guineensis var. tenera TaxID=51953 RepID=UPI003C6CCF7C
MSLMNGVVKILSKVLSKRLANKLDSLISPNQSAFIKDRNIADIFAAAKEMVSQVHKSKEKGIIYKLDFKKAFDNVAWPFLLDLLIARGFSVRWRCWIQDIITTAKSSIIVNDVLNQILRLAASNKIIKGLKINFAKSTSVLGLGLTQIQRNHIATTLGSTTSEFPLRYLGIPLHYNKLKTPDWLPLIEKINKKLVTWKGIIKQLDELRRAFLWSGEERFKTGKCLLKWSQICRPKEYGEAYIALNKHQSWPINTATNVLAELQIFWRDLSAIQLSQYSDSIEGRWVSVNCGRRSSSPLGNTVFTYLVPILRVTPILS